ncbi:MAG: molybdenum cofactor guanylyltransferase [Deltaproteobacteria bacterium]|jgi:molybdopterin-guanine dinucleotide biosynthesis protein A|nr:molybdenum cofactor guanylyltransferase [Deltaproteobacteria bacterium]
MSPIDQSAPFENGAKPFPADTALILAGGRGLRMGYDKKRLALGGKSVLERLLEGLGPLFAKVLVSSNDPVPGLEALPDTLGSGPLAGIYQGLLHSPSDWLYVIACDMPFVNPGYIAHLRSIVALGACDVCLTSRQGGRYEPFNAFYSKNCLNVIKEALERGEYKIQPVVDRLRVAVIPPEIAKTFGSETMFFNINRPGDLDRAEARLRDAPPGPKGDP